MLRTTSTALAAIAIAAATAVVVANAGTAAKPAAAMRLQRLAHADPGSGYTGDVFGHLGYAYLSSWHGGSCPAQGVRVYDVHDPKSPHRVSTFADARSEPKLAGTWTEKTIVQHVDTPSFKGELAVTSFQNCGHSEFQGFGLYDVTKPSDPKQLSLVRLDPRGSHEIWLARKGRRAYVYTAIPRSELYSAPGYGSSNPRPDAPGKPDFRIYDVTNPKSPAQVGEWGAWKQLGIKPWDGRGHFSANFVHSVITNAAATRAYLSYWDLGTVILDIRDPEHPRYLGHTPQDPEGDAHSAALARNGKILVETHETVNGKPTLYDISKPAHPRKLSTISVGGAGAADFTGGVHDPKVRGNRAYFSWYRKGVVVADISNVRKPRVVARFSPPASADEEHSLCSSASCTLVWGVYAEKNYVLASDMLSGLWVLRLSPK
jgi:hypothetical protein